jgi:F-type H+-transporting ATPase subunit epsilon
MRLKVAVPTEILLLTQVAKVKAETANGCFCVLPRHVDFVTELVPGILIFDSPDGHSQYVAIDHGILVKCGSNVSISTRNAVLGADLGSLKETVETHFRRLQEKEQAARVFEAKLEADLVRQLLEVEKYA